jgi:hypothetical protein
MALSPGLLPLGNLRLDPRPIKAVCGRVEVEAAVAFSYNKKYTKLQTNQAHFF